METLSPCKAITKKGTPCPFRPKPGSEYCGHHQPEDQKVRDFIGKHKQEVMAYLLGTASDPVASDIYDYLKEGWGFKHLVPPQRIITQSLREERPEEIGRRFQKRKRGDDLWKIIPYISIGEEFNVLTNWLGSPIEVNPYPVFRELGRAFEFKAKDIGTGFRTIPVWLTITIANKHKYVPKEDWGTIRIIRFEIGASIPFQGP